MKKTKKINKVKIVKILITLIFILIAINNILIKIRLERLENIINETDSKCLRYYESALEILK